MLSAVITVINWMEGNIFLSCCFGISSEHCLIGGLGLGCEGFFWISCPRCEKMDLKISHCWKGLKYTEMQENQRICGT